MSDIGEYDPDGVEFMVKAKTEIPFPGHLQAEYIEEDIQSRFSVDSELEAWPDLSGQRFHFTSYGSSALDRTHGRPEPVPLLGIPPRYVPREMDPIENSIHRPDVNDLSEIQKLAQAASAKMPSLNKAQLKMLKSQLEDVLQRTDARLQETNWPSHEAQLTTPPASGSNMSVKYRCVLCNTSQEKPGMGTPSSLKRHLATLHGLNENRFQCSEPDCLVSYNRKDSLRTHIIQTHLKRPTAQDLQNNSFRLPCPSICSLCPRGTSSWDEFYLCMASHCKITPTGNYLSKSPKEEHKRGKRTERLRVSPPPQKKRKRETKTTKAPEQKSPGCKSCRRCNHRWDTCSQCKIQPKTTLRCHNCLSALEWEPRINPVLVLPPRQRVLRSSTKTEGFLNPGLSSEPFGTGIQHTAVTQRRQSTLRCDSDSSSARSSATNITRPDIDEDSIDAGISETKDMSHILDAAQYFSGLDDLELKTAQTLGMDKGPYSKPMSLDDCYNYLKDWRSALVYLRSQGFCGNTMTILVDRGRDGIADAIHVSLSHIDHFMSQYKSLRDSLDDVGLATLTKTWMHGMLSVREDVFSSSNLEGLVRGLCIVLSIGLLSFTGSHVCRFDLNVWNKEMEEIAVGLDEYSFQPRKLACLDDFIGGPAWILGQGTKKEQQQQEGMKLSITVQDLQELWGPVSLLGGTADEAPVIRTERGFIVALPREQQTSSYTPLYENEIECHWTTEVPKCLTEKNSEVPILLSSTSRILIGTTSETKVGLVVNQKCKSSIATIQQQIACRLQYPGTCKSRYMSDGYDVQLVGGQYVTAGIMKKYKRIPKRTLKAMLIEDCAKPGTRLVPLLNLRVGLEVSACTGNAQRVTLWDALRLSQASIESTDDPMYCAHEVGDRHCISSCWTRCRSADDIDCDDMPRQGKPFSGVEARRVIISSILALKHSGVDSEGNLQVSWPFSTSPVSCPVFPSTSKEAHHWFRVVKDTRDTSSFAVFSQRCLEFPEQGLVRPCSAPCKNGHFRPLQTILSTRILTVTKEGSVSGLLQGARFLIGEAHLTVTKAVQESQMAMIVAAVSMNPLSPLRYHLREILPDAKSFDFKEHIRPDITAGLSVPVFVY